MRILSKHRGYTPRAPGGRSGIQAQPRLKGPCFALFRFSTKPAKTQGFPIMSKHRKPCLGTLCPANSFGRLHTPMTLSLVNVRSVRSKSADLLELVCDMKSDVICLTETWHTQNDVAARNRATPSGYELLDQPRIGRKGGCLAIFYMDNLISGQSCQHIPPALLRDTPCDGEHIYN